MRVNELKTAPPMLYRISTQNKLATKMYHKYYIQSRIIIYIVGTISSCFRWCILSRTFCEIVPNETRIRHAPLCLFTFVPMYLKCSEYFLCVMYYFRILNFALVETE